jgi:DNA-binding HxlR family transcriptional regulator
MAKRLPKEFNCAVEFALEVLGGKWKTVILCYLKVEPLRYADLRQLIPALSEKVLTERLRDLQNIGLIEHRNTEAHRGGVYALTTRGRSLEPILAGLDAWGTQNASVFAIRVGRPLARLRETRALDVGRRTANADAASSR